MNSILCSFSSMELKVLNLVTVARLSQGNSLYFKWLILAVVEQVLLSIFDAVVKFQVAMV